MQKSPIRLEIARKISATLGLKWAYRSFGIYNLFFCFVYFYPFTGANRTFLRLRNSNCSKMEVHGRAMIVSFICISEQQLIHIYPRKRGTMYCLLFLFVVVTKIIDPSTETSLCCCFIINCISTANASVFVLGGNDERYMNT